MTVRAFLVGLCLVAFFSSVVAYADLYLQGSKLAFNHLPISALVSLFVLTFFVNTLIGRIAPRRRLNRRELAVIYIMVLVAAPWPSGGYVELVMPVISAATYYATPENQYERIFGNFLHDWLAVTDKRAARWFYEGLPAGQPIPWGPWVKPLVSWGLLALLMAFTFFCLAVLLRRQWIEHERLTFPLAQVPLEMIQAREQPDAGAPFFRSRVMWFGFGSVMLLHIIVSLHQYFPAVPAVNLGPVKIAPGLMSGPFRALRDIEIFFYPCVVGVSYLISQDVAASLWGFFLFAQAQKVAMTAYGVEPNGPFGKLNAMAILRGEEIGAFLVLAVTILWAARKRLRDAPLRDPTRPLGERWAAVGFLAGTLAMAGWGAAAGGSFIFCLLAILLFYVMSLGLTRLVNAGGSLWVEANWVPYDVLNTTFGSLWLGPNTLTIIGMQEMVFMWDQRYITMPFLMDSFKVAHSCDVRGRHLALAMLVAILAAVLIGSIAGLVTVYRCSGVNLDSWYMREAGVWPYNDVKETLESPVKPNLLTLTSMGIGGLIAAFMIHAHARYAGWRLSPLGFLFGSTWTMGHLWFSVFLGWLASALATRAGGLRLYRRLRPMFIGFVLGEFVTAALWIPIDAALGVRGHVIFPKE